MDSGLPRPLRRLLRQFAMQFLEQVERDLLLLLPPRRFQPIPPAARPRRTKLGTAYAVLGVAPTAPREVVEAAYRALAKKYHPDTGGDHRRMVEINTAYSAVCRARGWK